MIEIGHHQSVYIFPHLQGFTEATSCAFVISARNLTSRKEYKDGHKSLIYPHVITIQSHPVTEMNLMEKALRGLRPAQNN